MKTLKLIIVGFAFILLSCGQQKKDVQLNDNINQSYVTTDQESLKLLQHNCYACHSATSTSHDAIIAPPMAAVKKRYLMSYNSKEKFVEAFTAWTLNPTEESALMPGAVQNFNVMPKQPFDNDVVTKIATYIFENELEQPSWYQDHFNNEHSNRMGKGKGQRRGGI